MLPPNFYKVINGASTAIPAGAAPKTLAGTTVITNQVQVGSLSALVVANARTNTLTLTGKWQVSDDNSTFQDFTPINNATNVALVTGTGSDVTATRAFEAPHGIFGWKYARFVLTSGVGVADGTNDAGTISYRYLMHWA